MRTSVTVAKKHSGEWVLLHSPEVSIVDQHSAFKVVAGGGKANADYSEYRIQDSDGTLRQLKFITPDEEKKRAAAHAKVLEQVKKEAEAASAPKENKPAELVANIGESKPAEPSKKTEEKKPEETKTKIPENKFTRS